MHTVTRRRRRPGRRGAPIMAAAILAAGLAARAAAVPAEDTSETAPCPTHVVEPGETLRVIAERHFGSRDRSVAIHAANRALIGPDPNVISPGLRLAIPCHGGGPEPVSGADAPPMAEPVSEAPASPEPSAPQRTAGGIALFPAPDAPGSAEGAETAEGATTDAAASPPLAPGPDVSASPAPVAAGPVHVLTGAPFPPFVDPADPQGGMLTEIVLAAFAATDGPPVEIAFVNDPPAHLDILLPRGGFAFSFPWLMPDCADPAQSGTPLCAEFTASASLYEHVTEFYAREDGPFATAREVAALAGARLCRPEGYPLRDLAEAGMLDAPVEVVRRQGARGCLDALDAGEVDIASLDAAVVRALVAAKAPEAPLVVLESFTRIEQMRALARRGDPDGEAAIARLSEGIARIAESGEWFAIVRRRAYGTGN